MKYGYFVWIDEEDRKVKITDKRMTLGEFLGEVAPDDFEHKWNKNTWCVPMKSQATRIQTEVAKRLAGSTETNPRARNTGLFGISGPAVGEF